MTQTIALVDDDTISSIISSKQRIRLPAIMNSSNVILRDKIFMSLLSYYYHRG